MIQKFIWKGKEVRITKTILKKKKKMGAISLLDFNTDFKAIVMKP